MEIPSTRRIIVALMLLLVCAFNNAPADILVKKDGTRIFGDITETERVYRVVKPDGRTTLVVKNKVAEVFRTVDMQARFRKLRPKLDPMNNSQVDYLIRLGKDAGLVNEVDTLMQEVYAIRRQRVARNAGHLRYLAKWCTKHGLVTENAECERAAMILEFDSKIAAMDDAAQLARLSFDYAAAGCSDEAHRAQDAAIKQAPDDKEVRKLLGYVTDPKSGDWVKPKSPWRAEIVEAAIVKEYRETYVHMSPKANEELLEVSVRFAALEASATALRDFLDLAATDLAGTVFPRLLASDVALLHKEHKKAALLNGNTITLSNPKGESSPIAFIGKLPGKGVTLSSDGVVKDLTGGGSVLSYYRGPGLAVALVEPYQEITASLLFLVPNGVTSGLLRFRELPPLPVSF